MQIYLYSVALCNTVSRQPKGTACGSTQLDLQEARQHMCPLHFAGRSWQVGRVVRQAHAQVSPTAAASGKTWCDSLAEVLSRPSLV